MSRRGRKKRTKMLEKIRKSEEKEVNLIPFSPDCFQDLKHQNINQLWRWDTLEDVKL
jgi:hypothetical protein